MIPTRSVVAELGERMASARRQGLSFERAWKRNVRHVLTLASPNEATEWQAALRATRRAWRLAYEREPIPGADALRALVAGL